MSVRCFPHVDPRFAGIDPRPEGPNVRPRDAASLIVVDRSGAEPRVLLGRRHDDHAFMPGVFVFPGGRVDVCDHRVAAATDALHPSIEGKLLVDMKGRRSARRARALALAAIRETFEETGLVVGARADAHQGSRSPVWQAFLSQGFVPKLGPLRYVARAITPPGRRRRYDTRFFCADAAEIAARRAPPDGELLDISWMTPAEARACRMHLITRVILADVLALLDRGELPEPGAPVPYYAMRHGRMMREII